MLLQNLFKTAMTLEQALGANNDTKSSSSMSTPENRELFNQALATHLGNEKNNYKNHAIKEGISSNLYADMQGLDQHVNKTTDNLDTISSNDNGRQIDALTAANDTSQNSNQPELSDSQLANTVAVNSDASLPANGNQLPEHNAKENNQLSQTKTQAVDVNEQSAEHVTASDNLALNDNLKLAQSSLNNSQLTLNNGAMVIDNVAQQKQADLIAKDVPTTQKQQSNASQIVASVNSPQSAIDTPVQQSAGQAEKLLTPPASKVQAQQQTPDPLPKANEPLKSKDAPIDKSSTGVFSQPEKSQPAITHNADTNNKFSEQALKFQNLTGDLTIKQASQQNRAESVSREQLIRATEPQEPKLFDKLITKDDVTNKLEANGDLKTQSKSPDLSAKADYTIIKDTDFKIDKLTRSSDVTQSHIKAPVTAGISSQPVSLTMNQTMATSPMNLTTATVAEAQSSNNQNSTLLLRDTALAVNVPKKQWNQRFAERISMLTLKGTSHARIRLDPPELGPMAVRIHTQGGETSIQFTVNNAIARELVDSGTQRLRDMLEEQGFSSVDVGVNEFARGSEGQQDSELDQSDIEFLSKSETDAEKDQHPIATYQDSIGIIDIFA